MRSVSTTICACLVTAVATFAQTTTGTIAGRILDQQGAAVQRASITATEPAKNINVTTNSNESGDFLLAALQPGNYTIRVEAPGFKKLERTNVALDANDKLALGDILLQVGAVTEQVEVSGQVTLLQTESVERSATLVSKQMENIEVNGRNPLDMAKLIPGVVSTANFSVGGVGGLSGLQVNGQRGTENQLTINGIGDIDTGANGSQNVTVSLDSMQEFKILTGTYQAEYGRNAGAQISLVTKSGSSDFHGSGYWYHRHDDLNANTFINNARGLPRNLFRFNDPGYTIGGPVYIPKLLHATKNRVFFFWSQEYQRQLQPNALTNRTVPTALERKGDFSQSVDNNGKPLTIKDPATGQPFPGNIIPASRFYAPGQALLNLFPLPNTSGIGYNYSSQLSSKLPRREDLLRLDYNLSNNVRVFGHWIGNVFPQVLPYGSFVLAPNPPVTNITDTRPGHSIAAGVTWVIAPTMTNEANWGFTKNKIDIFEVGNVLRRKTSGVALPLLYPNALQDDYIPQVNFGGTHLANSPGFTSNDAPFHNYNTSIDISDNLTKIWGVHTLKAGIFLQRSRKDQTSFSDNNGSYNFGDTASNPLDSGYGYSNALLGVYQTMDQSSAYINGRYRYWNIEGFIQDTWKITPRVTLDYGLRISWYQPQYDASQTASTFVLSAWDPNKAPRLYQPVLVNGTRMAYDPVTNQTLPGYDIGLEVPGSGDPFNGVLQAGKGVNKYLQQDPGAQWGPRFGVAWDVTGKQTIVVRTGGGIYYDRFQGNRVFDFVRNPPETVQPTLFYGYAQDINPATALLGPPTLYAADPTGKVPTTYTYQFSIQTKLPFNTALDTAYVGSQGRHLQDNRNLNPVPYGATFLPQNQDPTLTSTALLGSNALPANFLRPLRGFGQIALYESAATSNYNALQLQLNKRFGSGLFFGAAYTWSRAMTTAQADTTWVRADQYTRAAEYGPANFDRRQVFTLNYVYNLPNMKEGNWATHLVTNGWQLSGVTLITTGAPFTPGFSISGASSQNITGNVTASNNTQENARLAMVPGCDPYTHSSDPFNRLNAACFKAPQPGSLGLESGINDLYAPGLIDFDVSLQKEFSIKERVRFQFRVDAFNVFNHSNFTGLNSTLNFTAYPNPVLAANATPYNAAGQLVNVTGFGSATVPAPGAQGSARILQTLIRIQF
ncbi:MAG: TonB-dependent receptor [Acidobacteriaceae bacterium]|nr:TonB-dependent receptor [Acidobacteriaceae bacterium]